MDKFSEMQMFVSVIDAGSMSEAARRLGTTKSAVSLRITQLETRLGTALLERQRPVRPTVPGRLFYEQSVRILTEVDAAENAVSAVHSSLGGNLRIALPMAFGIRYLSPVMVGFARRYPQLCLDLDFNDRLVNLHDESYDLAIRLGPLQDSSLVAQSVCVNRHVICASPSYLAERGVPLEPEDLSEHDGLLYVNREPLGMWQLPVDGELRPFRIGNRMRTDSAHHLLAAARGGLGLAILPTFIAADAIATNELQIVLPRHSPSGGFVSAIYRKTHRKSPKIQALVSFLSEQIGEPPPWDRPIQERLPVMVTGRPDPGARGGRIEA